jgi:hypothetical protein
MAKGQHFSSKVEEPNELQVFKNTTKSVIFRVATHSIVFPCVDAITRILNIIDVNDRYV